MPLPLAADAPTDFDFIIGDWRVEHRRLASRFAHCTEWTAFDGLSSTRKTLGGFGNLEDNLLHFPDGPFRAVALRSFCPASAGSTTTSACFMPTTCWTALPDGRA